MVNVSWTDAEGSHSVAVLSTHQATLATHLIEAGAANVTARAA